MSYTTGQQWGAMKKLWKGYKIAKIQRDEAKMKEYASNIRALAKEMGINVPKFPELGLE